MTSLAVEGSWREVLGRCPAWQPPSKRTVIVVPHPDDESLSTGGLIALQRQRDVDVVVVAVSDGEAAYSDVPELGLVRTHEQERALRLLGVEARDVVRLGLPDGSVSRHVDELAAAIVGLVDAQTLLVAPWVHDVHPDHEACGSAAAAAAALAGSELLSSLFWAWHHVPVESMPLQSMVRIELDDQLIESRVAAVLCHSSQLAHDDGSPVLPPALLGSITRSFEAYLR